MLHIILNIIMWILIAFLVVLVAFWVYGMITSKDFRDANIEGWKASVREHERKKRPKRRPEDSELYKRTGKRHFLDRDHRNDYKNYYGD